MIKVEYLASFNFEGAVRGMRNPMNSWAKSDSEWMMDDLLVPVEYNIGPNDLGLMQRLYKAGPEHRKYLRQIFVCCDVTAPFYWWKEASTYKIGTDKNSCSTMHKLTSRDLTIDDFSYDHMRAEGMASLKSTIERINLDRREYLKTKDKQIWYEMIQLLPSSYNQRRTFTMNYENVMNIINQRSNHKLDEWREFVKELRTLPYVNEIRGEE